MAELDDIDDKEFGKAAYAHSLVMETMLLKIIAETAFTANSEHPEEAVAAMRSNMSGLWNSKSVKDGAGEELLALMQHYSDNFWDQVKVSVEKLSAAGSIKN